MTTEQHVRQRGKRKVKIPRLPAPTGLPAETRFGLALLMSLAIWAPTLMVTLDGDLSISAALIRYALGLVLSLVGVNLVDHLIRSYHRSNRERELRLLQTRATPQRRRGDRPATLGPEGGAAPTDDVAPATSVEPPPVAETPLAGGLTGGLGGALSAESAGEAAP